MSADNTGPEQRGVPFAPGQSGNPNGRPKGARNKLGEDFIQALYVDWREHGKAALDRVRTERPHEYLKLIASLLPKRIELGNVSAFDDWTDDDLAVLLGWARGAIAQAKQEASDEAETIAADIAMARPVTH